MPCLVRPESPADASAIAALTTAAFLEAPHRSGTEAAIVDALRDAGALSVSLVAQDTADGHPRLIGHVAASPVTIADGSPHWHGLGPISVLPGHQRRGIGSALMRAALDELRRQGAAGCVLLGDPAYYRRFGFLPRSGLVLEGVPPEYFMALTLDASSLAQGAVRYHAAFDAT